MAKAKPAPASQDQQTLDLIKEVNRRKAEISQINKPNWITNCSFSFLNGNLSGAINLHVEASLQTLIQIVSFLNRESGAYKETAAALNVENPPEFKWNGFSVADWTTDVSSRIKKIQVTSKQKKLDTLEARLNAIITPELRAKLELEAIASELGD